MNSHKKNKKEYAISANLAYGQVRLETSKDVGEEYEVPDKLDRSGYSGGSYEPTGGPVPGNKFPGSSSTETEEPVYYYTTADLDESSAKYM